MVDCSKQKSKLIWNCLLVNRVHTFFCRTQNKKICQIFLSFARNPSDKYRTELLDTVAKTGLYVLKTASKKIIDKAAEATGAFIGNKFVDKIVKPKPVTDKNSRNVEKNI